MRILTTETFKKIVPLLRENYGNLHAQMALKLPPSVAEMFANFTQQAVNATGQWSVTLPYESELQPFTRASEIEKDQISIAIKQAGEALRKAFPAMADKLIEVPDADSIWFAPTPAGVRVVLTQWGFRRVKSAGGISIVRLCLQRAETLSNVPVRLLMKYSDGSLAAGKDFTLLILNTELPFTTDGAGTWSAAHIKVGAQFRVEAPDGTKSAAFTVEPDRELYEVVMDRHTTLTVMVLDANGIPVPGVETLCGGERRPTDGAGRAVFDSLVVGRNVQVSATGFEPVEVTLLAEPDKNLVEFRLPPVTDGGDDDKKDDDRHDGDTAGPDPTGDVCLLLQDKHGLPQANLPVQVLTARQTLNLMTDATGRVRLPHSALQAGEKPKIRLRRPKQSSRLTQSVPKAPAHPENHNNPTLNQQQK